MKQIETKQTFYIRKIFVSLRIRLEFEMNMNIRKLGFILLASLLIFVSCGKNSILDQMNRIKMVGNVNPSLALSMLDSIKLDVRKSDAYVQMKYDLLTLRLNDKAYNMPKSDMVAKQVVKYFAKYGSEAEKQEALYYCGSVYRDLKDIPRAMDAFLKSMEIGEKQSNIDSIILKNTYSNLHYLFYKVQDQRNSLIYARKEYKIAKEIKLDSILPMTHLLESYYAMDSISQAKETANGLLEIVDKQKNSKEILSNLIFYLSKLGELDMAKKSISMLSLNHGDELSNQERYILAEFYRESGNQDSALIYYQNILSNNPTREIIYDVTKVLFGICVSRDDMPKAIKYAEEYINISDSLDLGRRQEMAATVNNQFQYHLDKGKEEKINEKASKYKDMLIISLIILIIVVLSGLLIFLYKRNINLKEQISLSEELKKQKADKEILQNLINRRTEELENAKKSLNNLQDKLKDVNSKLSEQQSTLKEEEQLLNEKMEQNKAFIRLLHKSDFEGTADDVINAIKQSSDGHKHLADADWKQLYSAVDELYPNFKNKLSEKLGSFTEQQMRVCYLIRIGLTKPQIQHLTDIPRVTIWRWSKKFDWINEYNKYDK